MRRKLGFGLIAATSAFALAACGSASGGATETDDPTDGTAATGGSGDINTDPIQIGVPAGWDEGVAVSALWAAILEDKGYTVELADAEIGLIFADLASDESYDLLFDGWLPQTHKEYIDKYGADLDDLGVWYDNAALSVAVNNDAPITSLAELADNADAFNNRIVGIDPGAGLTQAMENEVIPTYGLEDMDFVTSSTASMLAELKGAMQAGDNIVVTLWHPHWAYSAYDIRDLEDPEGTLGTAEEIHTFARKTFADDYPQVAEWISNFTFADEDLASLENDIVEAGDPQAGVQQWLEDNPDFPASVTPASE
ncbi:glycine betaine ABC transporter substrate-binding protein [Pseudactinotalea sp. HY158]|uniref:glycine betaine ABC transporter substrate-binding protein n=1 Tax=Pseudactinotalea sp. HY158 TaxID=2654547 RepID=UPI00129C6C4D|nr:glycine betaine ABC transporter substrate-binding protein [Pseudactinotalea sp. HY158]QGH68843.1 glycine/betaine ABC transporter substrate-binding protein [Pseudactinotalea sp. HY158]